MIKTAILSGALMLVATTAHAQTSTVTDATGDFLSSYTFAQSPDLDVTSFTVSYDQGTSVFTLSATMAGIINSATPGLYVIGVNNGTATATPFAAIGAPDVKFNQAIVVQKTGAANIGAASLAGSVTGNAFTVVVPLSALLQSTFAPETYGFNLWPRIGTGGGNAQISDFSPNNAMLSVQPSAVPEPSAWALMIGGFGLVGGTLRKRRRVATVSLA